jgi:hypothetical protein
MLFPTAGDTKIQEILSRFTVRLETQTVEEGLNNFTLYLHSPKEETGF